MNPGAVIAVLVLLLAACDGGGEYKEAITVLEADLRAAQEQNDMLRAELEQLRAQGGEGGGIPGSLQSVQAELSAVMDSGEQTLARMAELENPPEAVQALRQDLEDMMRSLDMVAQELGVEGRAPAGEPPAAGAGQ